MNKPFFVEAAEFYQTGMPIPIIDSSDLDNIKKEGFIAYQFHDLANLTRLIRLMHYETSLNCSFSASYKIENDLLIILLKEALESIVEHYYHDRWMKKNGHTLTLKYKIKMFFNNLIEKIKWNFKND